MKTITHCQHVVDEDATIGRADREERHQTVLCGRRVVPGLVFCAEHRDTGRRYDPGVGIATHRFLVTVKGCTLERAETVMTERLGPDEDYGFGYTVDWEMFR